MDDADRAQALEETQREKGIQTALLAEETQQQIIGDRVYCLGCNSEIPDERLKAKPLACRCIDCQELHEMGTP